MLYLYIVRNEHPEVMTRYKYLVIANSKAQAIKDMRNRDGQWNEHCIVESCEIQYPVAEDTWYLPTYTPEKL
jgi:hypothetical protein